MHMPDLQTYWGAFCAFADPFADVMGGYLSTPITEKVFNSCTNCTDYMKLGRRDPVSASYIISPMCF